jgi:HK97 family phage prohead protease
MGGEHMTETLGTASTADCAEFAELERRGEWQTFTRATPLELDEGDGRTLIGRVVPYNVIADVADPPTYQPYKEQFAPGAFRAQLAAANRIDVLLNYEHRQGISDIVGRGVSLDDKPDGLYGTFRMLTHADGDKALELYHAGVLRGLSTEFSVRPNGSRTVDGVVTRMDARIGNVALCREYGSGTGGPKAAYPGAEVLAVRTDDDRIDVEAPDSPPNVTVAVSEGSTSLVPALDWERLGAIGIPALLVRAVVRKPWDGSPARFTDEQYAASCLIDRGGDAPPKERCSLPVLEPNGDLNVNALGAAAGRIGTVQGATSEQKAAAARKLVRYYRMAQMMAPPRIMSMAGM